MDEIKTEYLSEEELNDLICQVEEKEMLRAPAYLKRETLQQIRQENRLLCPAPVLEKRRRRDLTLYSLKVGIAAAAAIAALFLMPAGGEGGKLWSGETNGSGAVVEHLSEKSDLLCQKLNTVSTWLVSGKNDEWK